ncbi:substrate-binding domain-containing protein [Yinghuangia sp. YIM S10712]|uniref:substrate-binding domain-containing protein n=1 Tax=Yinghuangia sp. YIM S10712 TaxID=3436930 RepID=UPI003F53501C
MKTLPRHAAALGLAAVLVLGAGACSDTRHAEPADGAKRPERAEQADNAVTGGDRTPGAQGFRIGLLLPDNTAVRYERFDKPFFEAAVAKLCPACEVRYANARRQAATQRQQAEAMFAGGVDVLVLDAVDTRAAASIVESAKAKDIPVIAYDRFAEGPISGYVSFDDETVGRIQGTALLEAIRRGGDAKRAPVIMVNGSPTDPEAAATKRGAHGVLDGHVIIGREYDTPERSGSSDSSEDIAREETRQAINALGGPGKVAGVHAADDRTAGGVIAALKAAGFHPLPPVTGQDAELAALRRIVAGDQYMTVFKPYLPEAQTAAAMAIAAATGVPYAKANQRRSNGTVEVAAAILEPVPVTRADLEDTVIREPYYSVADICTPQYADACRAAGLR